MVNLGLEEARERYQKTLDRALKKVVEILARLPEVQQIILFGSHARGRRDLFTDLDILVIMKTDEPIVARVARLYREIGGELGVDIDLLAYTPEELGELGATGFIAKALQEGRVLYARE